MALLQYDALYGNEKYREIARLLMDRILAENTDGWYGFTGGYDGWPEKDPEGTAFTALMYRLLGDEVQAVESLNALRNIQTYRGMIPASTVEQLPTGLDLFDGSSWNYSNDPHVAPTAWFVMAVNGFNPYTF